MRPRAFWGLLLLAVASAAVPACLQDFGQFEETVLGASGGDSGAEGGTNPMGGSGEGATEAGGAGTGATSGCGAGEKMCGTDCVPVDEPEFGCGSDSCLPCAMPDNTLAICDAGQCQIGGCAPGFSDCDDSADGCEHGPSTYSVSRCGGCGSDCSSLGLTGCFGGSCGCTTDAECGQDVRNRPHACVDSVCDCDGNVCRPGEICRRVMGESVCGCGGGDACVGALVCCPTADGAACADVGGNDPANCGGCGVTCSAGQVCVSGSCEAGN